MSMFYEEQFLYHTLWVEAILNGVVFGEWVDRNNNNLGRSVVAEYLEYLIAAPEFRSVYEFFFKRIESQYRVVQLMRKKYDIKQVSSLVTLV